MQIGVSNKCVTKAVRMTMYSNNNCIVFPRPGDHQEMTTQRIGMKLATFCFALYPSDTTIDILLFTQVSD